MWRELVALPHVEGTARAGSLKGAGSLPKTPPQKLKVFQAQFGFFDTVLAVPSQAAALRAWGTHRNLFATGHAKVATDEAAMPPRCSIRGLCCGAPWDRMIPFR